MPRFSGVYVGLDCPVVRCRIKAEWYIGHYVLPGNVQRVMLKPKQD